MPIPVTCPDVHEYERLRRGELSLPEVEQLAQHIEKCGRCADQLQNLPVDDTLIEALRARSTVTDPKEKDRVSDLVARLKQFRLPVNPAVEVTAAESPAAAALTPVDQTCEVYDFLAPPQGAGEIGRLGPYRVLKVLGTGGMGVVFQAEDVKLKRLVALKAIRPATAASAGAGQRFQREAEATAAIKHDHIVTIYQVGEDRGVPFLAMEFLEGMSLDDWLKKGRTPTLTQATRIGRQIALGLAEAHACGLIHRDIKPGNVWLDSRHQGRVKLLDFGLARGGADDDHQLTQSGAIVGTPAYMAPEQARGEKVDHRVDLFSLGVVLYRLTTGQLPFRGDNTMAVLTSLAMDTPTPPREVNPSISPRMASLIERLLCKDRAQRPATAKDVAVELAAIEREAVQPATDEGAVQINRAASVSAPVASSARSRLRLRWLVAASLFLLLGGALAAIVIRIKTPNGETKEMRFPDGTTVEVGHEKDVAQPGTPAVRVPPSEEAWRKQVAALPTGKQSEAVAARLKERNPGFDGKVELMKVEGGMVTEIRFSADHVTDLSPVQALVGLKLLECSGGNTLSDLSPLKDMKLTELRCGSRKLYDLSPLKGMKLTSLTSWWSPVSDLSPLKDMKLTYLDLRWPKVSDLSPLKDMKLTSLTCMFAPVSDLSPLKDMKLTYLDIQVTGVSDLSPLKGMPLTYLCIQVTPVSDLSPLKGMPLTQLQCRQTKVSDLSPLKGMPLTSLHCPGTPVSDLSPLKGMKLTSLHCDDTKVSDLSPLKGMPLKYLSCDFKAERDAEILRSIKTLESINRKPVAVFWKEVDAAKKP